MAFAQTFFSGLVISMVVSVAQADSFEMIKDGQTYRCESRGNGGGGSPGQAVECANKAYQGPFSREESMELCQGARSVGPAECARRLYAGPFDKKQAVQLCSRSGDLERAECAIRAYSGPYSKEEAIRLCSGGHAKLLKKAFMLMESSSEVQEKIFEIKLQQRDQKTHVQDI